MLEYKCRWYGSTLVVLDPEHNRPEDTSSLAALAELVQSMRPCRSPYYIAVRICEESQAHLRADCGSSLPKRSIFPIVKASIDGAPLQDSFQSLAARGPYSELPLKSPRARVSANARLRHPCLERQLRLSRRADHKKRRRPRSRPNRCRSAAVSLNCLRVLP